MGKDRYERRHRFTNPLRREASLTPAPNAPSQTLAEAMGITGRPSNFVAEINGHHIYRDDEANCFDLFTPGEGWWGFGITSEGEARRVCAVVAEPDKPHGAKSRAGNATPLAFSNDPVAVEPEGGAPT